MEEIVTVKEFTEKKLWLEKYNEKLKRGLNPDTLDMENDDEEELKAKQDRATIDQECPKCGHKKMYYTSRQMRSADEGETVIYECVKCGYRLKDPINLIHLGTHFLSTHKQRTNGLCYILAKFLLCTLCISSFLCEALCSCKDTMREKHILVFSQANLVEKHEYFKRKVDKSIEHIAITDCQGINLYLKPDLV